MDNLSVINNAVSLLPDNALNCFIGRLHKAYKKKAIEVSNADFLDKAYEICKQPNRKKSFTFEEQKVIVGVISHNITYFVPLVIQEVYLRKRSEDKIMLFRNYLLNVWRCLNYHNN